MDTSCWQKAENGRLNCYGIVSYINGELGDFLLGLRREIVTGCCLRSHLSLLTPRPLAISDETAVTALKNRLANFERFDVTLGNVTQFETTEVVYIDLMRGLDRVIDLHAQLNQNDLGCQERFAYHPHITLAQELPHEDFQKALDLCNRRWDEYRGPRSFAVETLTLTQYCDDSKRWIDVGETSLATPVSAR